MLERELVDPAGEGAGRTPPTPRWDWAANVGASLEFSLLLPSSTLEFSKFDSVLSSDFLLLVL